MIVMPKLVLASASPRRAEILRAVGWPFEALAANIDESRRDHEDATTYVERVARAKAEVVMPRVPGATVVGADTVVVVDGMILGKPADEEDARRMLQLLQGRWHQVLTGVAVFNGNVNQPRVSHEVTEVKFAVMNEDEVSWYVATGEPMDKAGAYAIQGLGARFIKGIKGDYSNVVGLPVRLLYELIVSEARP
jgi:septum formation protein